MEIENLSEEWIKATTEWAKSDENNHWSIDYVIDLPYDGKHDELWRFIKHTYKKDLSEKVVENLAAGPLEDLLAYFGEEYIEKVEALAKGDQKFKELLGGVWQNKMTDALWKRVCKIRGEAW